MGAIDQAENTHETSVNLRLAILTVLSRHASSRLTIEEIRREMESDLATDDRTTLADRASGMDGVDIFESGLVSYSDAGWQITEAGLSFLRSLDTPAGASSAKTKPDPSALKLLDELAAVDDLVSMEDRLRKFEVEMKRLDEEASRDDPDDQIDQTSLASHDLADARPSNEAAAVSETVENRRLDTPRLLRKPPRSLAGSANRKPSLFSALSGMAEARKRFLLQGFQLHSSKKEAPSGTTAKGPINAAAFAFFTVLGIAACVAAAVALSQIYSFKSENMSLQQELAKMRDHLARMEQAAIKKERDSSRKALETASTESQRIGRTPLVLSNDEIQIVREFIKPAPARSGGELEIKVGDVIDGPTIQLPSALVDRVPKLAGGRFTIRNGAIIIFRRDSKFADLVLPAS